ncbi:hypothetical protein AKO1_004282 [Acrasis kona]|uniref:phytol kinase n=1 Tax=Acrasis kona TaxID=1008807 RepID=A0AAW2Z7F7_9EUKA
MLSLDSFYGERYHVQNFITFVVTTAAALSLLSFFDYLANKKYVSSALSRKLAHIFTGPVFMLFWNAFSGRSPLESRLVASVIPLAITLQFYLIGAGIIKNEAKVIALSRTGKREEILKGPLYYGIVFVVCTTLFWRNSPAGVMGLCVLCGGDGLADVIGRKYGRDKLGPWSNKSNKSIAGSLGMFFGGLSFSVVYLAMFQCTGNFGPSFSVLNTLHIIILINIVATFVEVVTTSDLDNITVPAAVILLSILFM